MKLLAVAIVVLACAVPASAQAPPPDPGAPPVARPTGTSVRPYFVFAPQAFTANDSFEATLGSSVGLFWGGGVQIVTRNDDYLDISVSFFKKSGERAFFFEGESSRLGIPLEVKVLPIEATLGHRFRIKNPNVLPYLGVGGGFYTYRETSESEDDETTEHHAGFVVHGGAEWRMGRLLGLTGDVQYTFVPGILGKGGLSKDLGEDDLGGIALRVRVVVGR